MAAADRRTASAALCAQAGAVARLRKWAMTTSQTKTAKRVVRGAALLDREAPGWERKIDLPTLDMSSTTACVVGQTVGFGGWPAMIPQETVLGRMLLAASDERPVA